MESTPDSCPRCDSEKIAYIIWGMPDMDKDLERRIAEGKVVLGGCCIEEDDPEWECQECGVRWS